MSSPRAIVASQSVRFCLGPVEPARDGVGRACTGAATRARWELVLALGAESVEQAEVDLPAASEVVILEPAGDTGRARDVLDRDLVAGALGEQRVGGVASVG